MEATSEIVKYLTVSLKDDADYYKFQTLLMLKLSEL